MLVEPRIKRNIAFVDGQNLFYDAICLDTKIYSDNSWELSETRFFIGIPSLEDKPF